MHIRAPNANIGTKFWTTPLLLLARLRPTSQIDLPYLNSRSLSPSAFQSKTLSCGGWGWNCRRRAGPGAARGRGGNEHASSSSCAEDTAMGLGTARVTTTTTTTTMRTTMRVVPTMIHVTMTMITKRNPMMQRKK